MRTRYLALFLLLPLVAQAQMYRWVDDSGKVHYSDRAPSTGARNVEKQSMASAPSSPPLPYALQQAVRNFPVALYTSEACKNSCAQARELLNQRGVPYREYTIVDEADIAALNKLSGGSSVPILTVGREVYKGFEKGTYKLALDTAGYPGSSLLPPGTPASQPVTKLVQKPAAAAGEGGTATPPAEPAEAAAPTAPVQGNLPR